ncbi:MAG TPA: 16S rRNA (uracil(1498)-N(3))-methyltransferase [Streptosporangiaceae bacterium]|nr:16S rRNA (uracil(1498)-N(3))-methyltransferase [Streptosporangiaceae bacterium]
MAGAEAVGGAAGAVAGRTTPPVFLCDDGSLRTAAVVRLAGPEGRHATTVRRIGPGERVDLTDGQGLLARCVVAGARAGELELAVQERVTWPAPRCRVIVAQAILKGDRGELAVELMTEVGVDVIVPWAAERCVARWRPDRDSLGRWRSTAREAAKQSRRSWFPELSPSVRTAELAGRVADADLAVLLDPAAGCPMTELALPDQGSVLLVVGPEGGVTETEAAALTGAGAVTARLGPTVLRGSTAGAVAAALTLSRCGRWA